MTIPQKISDFFAQSNAPTPYLVVSLDKVADNYRGICAAMPKGKHHYAIKANPHPDVLKTLQALGGYFECASVPEIDMCLEAGAAPDQILYGNPLKKAQEIRDAYARGIRQFVFDAELELHKLIANAPGAKIICRIVTDGSGAVSPLSIKFGCPPAKAIEWMCEGAKHGLVPYGISFHTGSQQLLPASWEAPIRNAASIFEKLKKRGIHSMEVLNVGGGYPVTYRNAVPSIAEFGKAITSYVARYFTDVEPTIYTEPGRYMTGDAGHILSEVVLVTSDHDNPEFRWVYLDIGRYGGLVEEKIDYPIISNKSGPEGPVILAGQTCDSNDVIYRESFCYTLPLSLAPEDRVVLVNTGVYTTTYSTTLNGFPTLSAYCV